MAGRNGTFLERRRLRQVQEHWARLANAANAMDMMALRSWRARARAMRREIDRVIHSADARLSAAPNGAGLPRVPLGTDWVWRPDFWREPVPERGAAVWEPRAQISEDVALFHDCAAPEAMVRQQRNRQPGDLSPYGLALDIFGFSGGFLSVSLRFPDAPVQGLKLRHLIRLEAILETERPVSAYARLNIKHGPNTEQLVRELTRGSRDQMVEFDLAYAKLDEKRVEKIWLDIIFDNPAMNRIVLREVTISRRPRAEL